MRCLKTLPVRCTCTSGDLWAVLVRIRADFATGLGIVTARRNCVFLRLRKRKSSRDTSYGTKGKVVSAAHPPPPPARKVFSELEARELKTNWWEDFV